MIGKLANVAARIQEAVQQQSKTDAAPQPTPHSVHRAVGLMLFPESTAFSDAYADACVGAATTQGALARPNRPTKLQSFAHYVAASACLPDSSVAVAADLAALMESSESAK